MKDAQGPWPFSGCLTTLAASLARQKRVRGRGDGRILVDLVVDPCEDSTGRRHSESTCGQCDDLFNLLNRNACRQGFPYAGMHRALTHGTNCNRKFDKAGVLAIDWALSTGFTDLFPCLRQLRISPHESFIRLWWLRTALHSTSCSFQRERQTETQPSQPHQVIMSVTFANVLCETSSSHVIRMRNMI